MMPPINEAMGEIMDNLQIAIGSRYQRLGEISHKIRRLKNEAMKVQREIEMLETEGCLY